MKKAFAALFVVGAALVLTFAIRKKEYARVSSPDGSFVAIAEYRAYTSWLPMMPGQSGDKPGWVRVVSKRGVLIGEAKVPMVWFVNDIRWSKEEVAIGGAATWTLASK